ncbi:Protein of unknown function DUF2157, membrane [Halothece sp. PCC 7418]|uniref:DUF2157 domain-containing protein n=1 Tax=Halothece sp. (strain PCC 7418) TaxID=65093 RepID=UPI0002A06FD8|nr:DUF2157 domain-containing protein [Halothece sp. PCC 7418]AFZ44504.1 Protein of unknown function DUF2157, membrane [Halothece sp. PCC 7418]
MTSEKFRQQLKKEAETWEAEGLIDSSVFQQLAQRYQFQTLETDSQSRFVVILFAVGGILLGLGVITLVAANWQGWSKGLRVALLLTLFIGVNSAGYWGWQSSQPKWQRLGKGLLLLGALILGANLGLMSQMFHQSGAIYELYLVWGIGVLAMAYGLQFTWLAIFAIALIGLGYWWGLPSIFDPAASGNASLLMRYMPLVAIALYIPLAEFCRSRWVLIWGVVAVVSALEVSVIQELSLIDSSLLVGGMLTGAIALPPLLLWAYYPLRSDIRLQFHNVTSRLSVLFLGGVCYFFSFHYIWEDATVNRTNEVAMQHPAALVQLLIFASLTVYYWWRLGNQSHRPWRLRVDSTLFAGTTLFTGFVAGGAVAGLPFLNLIWLPTVIYNLILFFLAIALIKQGLNQGIRLNFWAGLLFLSLQIFSRMLEYQTDLLLKSIIFFLCGLAIVIAGLWFEGYLRQE